MQQFYQDQKEGDNVYYRPNSDLIRKREWPCGLSNRFRHPTDTELNLLMEKIISDFVPGYVHLSYEDQATERDNIWPLSVGVLEHYITGGPGWWGTLFYVVWDGSPEYLAVYGLTNATLTRMDIVIGENDFNNNLPDHATQ